MENPEQEQGGPWGPVYGLVLHHTGDDADDKIDLDLIVRGRAGLGTARAVRL